LSDALAARSLGNDATIGRLGMRLYPQLGSGYPTRPFVGVNCWHGGGADAIAFNGVSIEDAVPDNRYQLNVGMQGRSGSGWVVWGRQPNCSARLRFCPTSTGMKT
jgi:outer membrane autotransporter protein